jgi:hypothetical protein
MEIIKPVLKNYPLSIIFLLSVLQSCSHSQKKPAPDVSNIKVDFRLVRFDKALFQTDTQDLNKSILGLIHKYPSFSSLYFNQILVLPEFRDTIHEEFTKELKEFISDPEVREIYQLVQKNYSDDVFLKSELIKSLQYMKYYFPTKKEPVFYTLISQFSYANFIFQDSIGRDGLGISLDFFLGTSFDYKKIDPDNPMYSDYLNRSFNKEHMIKKTWEVWLEDKLGIIPNGRFIDYMLHEGKKLYVLEKLIPTIHDTVLFEYTPAQLDWCTQNKREMWSFFMSSNLLYSTELQKFKKYINPSPVSPGMPAEAPGKTGSYMGYLIIKSFMNRFPTFSISDLINIQDSQKLLNDAKFKPRNE